MSTLLSCTCQLHPETALRQWQSSAGSCSSVVTPHFWRSLCRKAPKCCCAHTSCVCFRSAPVFPKHFAAAWLDLVHAHCQARRDLQCPTPPGAQRRRWSGANGHFQHPCMFLFSHNLRDVSYFPGARRSAQLLYTYRRMSLPSCALVTCIFPPKKLHV